MKATELMIGDWYSWYAEGKEYYYQVSKDTFAEEAIDNFQPIPLTAEILEKNGFKDYDEIKEYQFEEDGEKYRFYLKKMYLDGKFDCWGTNVGGVLPSLIASVHELQHALRLCGLNELADNFKID